MNVLHNNTITDIVGVTTRIVNNWRCTLTVHKDKLYPVSIIQFNHSGFPH